MTNPTPLPSISDMNRHGVSSEQLTRDPLSNIPLADRRTYNTPWEPDPTVTSLSQYIIETARRPQVGERTLHADFGDPELGMTDAPPYVKVSPNSVVIGVMPMVAEMMLHNKAGILLSGKVAFRNASQDISIGGITSMNPLLMNCVPSTAITPISTLVFSIRTSPVFKAMAQDNDLMSNALNAPANLEQIPEPEPSTFEAVTNTGKKYQVDALTQEHARAALMAEARKKGERSSELVAIHNI